MKKNSIRFVFIHLNVMILLLTLVVCGWSQIDDASDNPSVVEVKRKLKHDVAARQRLLAWKALLQDQKPISVSNLLKKVNDFFNKLNYIHEESLTSSADIWLTPYEFLVAGGGDCEDFAIAKYFTLVTMGIPEKKIRITYVSVPSRNLAHMVLTYYPTPDAEPYILDNLTDDILLASQRRELVPVYSFNGSEVWLNERIGKDRPYGKPSNLSKWQEVLKRIRLEEGN